MNCYGVKIIGNTFRNITSTDEFAAGEPANIPTRGELGGDGAISCTFPWAHDNVVDGNTFDTCRRAIYWQGRGNYIRNNTFFFCTLPNYIAEGNFLENMKLCPLDRNRTFDVVSRHKLVCHQTTLTSSTDNVIESTYKGLGAPSWELKYANVNGNPKVEFRANSGPDKSWYGGTLTTITLGVAVDPVGFNTGTAPVRVQLWQLNQGSDGITLMATVIVDVPEDGGSGDTSLLTSPSVVVPLPAALQASNVRYRITVHAQDTGRTLRFRTSTNNTNGETSGIIGIATNGNFDYSLNYAGGSNPTNFFEYGEIGNSRGQIRVGGLNGVGLSRIAAYHITGTYPTVNAQSEVIVTKAASTPPFTGTGLVTQSPQPTRNRCIIRGYNVSVPFDASLVGGQITITGQVAQTINNLEDENELIVPLGSSITVSTPTTWSWTPPAGSGVRTTDQLVISSLGQVPSGLFVGNPWSGSNGNISFKVCNFSAVQYNAGAAYDFWVYAYAQ
jgi:hypothetical protein